MDNTDRNRFIRKKGRMAVVMLFAAVLACMLLQPERAWAAKKAASEKGTVTAGDSYIRIKDGFYSKKEKKPTAVDLDGYMCMRYDGETEYPEVVFRGIRSGGTFKSRTAEFSVTRDGMYSFTFSSRWKDKLKKSELDCDYIISDGEGELLTVPDMVDDHPDSLFSATLSLYDTAHPEQVWTMTVSDEEKTDEIFLSPGRYGMYVEITVPDSVYRKKIYTGAVWANEFEAYAYIVLYGRNSDSARWLAGEIGRFVDRYGVFEDPLTTPDAEEIERKQFMLRAFSSFRLEDFPSFPLWTDSALSESDISVSITEKQVGNSMTRYGAAADLIGSGGWTDGAKGTKTAPAEMLVREAAIGSGMAESLTIDYAVIPAGKFYGSRKYGTGITATDRLFRSVIRNVTWKPVSLTGNIVIPKSCKKDALVIYRFAETAHSSFNSSADPYVEKNMIYCLNRYTFR